MIRSGRRKLSFSATVLAALCAAGWGCSPAVNPTQPMGESHTLNDVVQLTRNHARAGEAYFSPDMRWIIFQATPHGQENYQMYVARLRYETSGTTRAADF